MLILIENCIQVDYGKNCGTNCPETNEVESDAIKWLWEDLGKNYPETNELYSNWLFVMSISVFHCIQDLWISLPWCIGVVCICSLLLAFYVFDTMPLQAFRGFHLSYLLFSSNREHYVAYIICLKVGNNTGHFQVSEETSKKGRATMYS